MEIDDRLKEELHLHTLAMEERHNVKARLLCESDYFDRILEMNTEVERRKIAAMAMQAILNNPSAFNSATMEFPLTDGTHNKYFGVAQCAVAYADALIAELNKKKDGK